MQGGFFLFLFSVCNHPHKAATYVYHFLLLILKSQGEELGTKFSSCMIVSGGTKVVEKDTF